MAFFGLLRPRAPRPDLATMERVRRIVEDSPRALARLAFLGDKRFIFSPSGRTFVMYGIQGRTWVALGDPVGPVSDAAEAMRAFTAACRRAKADVAFYGVDETLIPHYLDQGLSLYKIGEEARLPLRTLSLEGGGFQKFRQLLHRADRDRISFEVVEARRTAALLPELKKISDAWVSKKRAKEKGFSLGFFSEDYLVRFPTAVLRRNGRVTAFTNVCVGDAKKEICGDVVRYYPDNPQSVMDLLYLRLMLWGKEEGYESFNLGMAPLSGLPRSVFSPVWNRVGTFVFLHGEHFYHFKGLRQYKEKFRPQWAPKYLASVGGLKTARVFADITALVSRGGKGVIAK
jgi:phosphatidylglycerol lysyltransferase